MYHGKRKINYKFSVSGKWINNNSSFTFGFLTERAAENWIKKNNLERFAYYHFVSKKINGTDTAT